jgi:hypothetical protein
MIAPRHVAAGTLILAEAHHKSDSQACADIFLCGNCGLGITVDYYREECPGCQARFSTVAVVDSRAHRHDIAADIARLRTLVPLLRFVGITRLSPQPTNRPCSQIVRWYLGE